MDSPAIELEKVGLSFSAGETLLNDVSIRVRSGESLVLIGPSGHGKSTLLKIMAGLVQPSVGSARVMNQDWRLMPESKREILVRRMGFLFQKNALFDSLTCAENVAFPMREVANASEKEIKQAIDYYLEAVGIPHARDLFPDEISGGMQKRLGIARALALKPQIVFYDDPTAGLDPITSRKIIHLIMELKTKMGMTVVAVTNDMNRADQMADRIAMVVDRELIICGTPEETKNHPDLRVRQFIRGSLEGPLMVQA